MFLLNPSNLNITLRVETNHAQNYYHNYHITIYNFSYIQVRGAKLLSPLL
nr:MAG TPA: hypothetical protein [Caudoviricetes sp.]